MGEEYIKKSDINLTDFEIIMCNGNYKMALKMLLEKIDKLPTIKIKTSNLHNECNTNHIEATKESIISSIIDAKITDAREEMISDLYKQITEIYKILAEHEKQISNLERK